MKLAYIPYGLAAYLLVTTAFLPSMEKAKRRLNESRNKHEWDRSDEVTILFASLLWPLLIAEFLLRGFRRKKR